MSKYETSAGHVTQAEAFSKLLDLLRQSQDQCLVISHLISLQDDDRYKILAKGWAAIAQMIDMMHHQVLKLGQGKLR